MADNDTSVVDDRAELDVVYLDIKRWLDSKNLHEQSLEENLQICELNIERHKNIQKRVLKLGNIAKPNIPTKQNSVPNSKTQLARQRSIDINYEKLGEDLANMKLTLESDFVNKIQQNIFKIGGKLQEYESLIKGSVYTEATLKDRIKNFNEDIFSGLEKTIDDQFDKLINKQKRALTVPSVCSLPERMCLLERERSSTLELLGGKKRHKKTINIENTDNLTQMYFSSRIDEVFDEWQNNKIRTQEYYIALLYRENELNFNKKMMEKIKNWIKQNSSISTQSQVIQNYEKAIVETKLYESLEKCLEEMKSNVNDYNKFRECSSNSIEIKSFTLESMNNSYTKYVHQFNEKRDEIEAMVPKKQAEIFLKCSVEFSLKQSNFFDKIQLLNKSIDEIRTSHEDSSVNFKEELSECQNELQTCYAAKLEFEKLFLELPSHFQKEKKIEYQQYISILDKYTTDLGSAKNVLENLWKEKILKSFCHSKYFSKISKDANNSQLSRLESFGAEEVLFLKSQAEERAEDVWIPSFNLTNVNAAADILAEMFGQDGDEDEDFSDELLSHVQQRVNDLIEWCKSKSSTIPIYATSNMTVSQAEESFQTIQGYKLEYEDSYIEFQRLKEDNKSLLKSGDVFTPGDAKLQNLFKQITDEENKLGLFLCFTYDFMNDRNSAYLLISNIQATIDNACISGVDIPTGVAMIENSLAQLNDHVKLVSKANRKCVHLKKKYSPSEEITDQSKELSDKFVNIKSSLTERLAGAQAGQTSLGEYGQKLTAYDNRLTECEGRVTDVLKKDIIITNNTVLIDEVNNLLEEIKTSQDEFTALQILPDPSPTEFTIPKDVTQSHDATVNRYVLLSSRLSSWMSHITTINSQLHEISAI